MGGARGSLDRPAWPNAAVLIGCCTMSRWYDLQRRINLISLAGNLQFGLTEFDHRVTEKLAVSMIALSRIDRRRSD